MLSESVRNWIVQVAIDYVREKKMPDDPFESKEEEECFWNTVKEMQEDKKKGIKATYDVSYDY